MTVRLVTDIQNRLFWRVGTGRGPECCVAPAGWSRASRDGQRLRALILSGARTGWSWSRRLPWAGRRGRCLVRTSAGSADGFTALSSCSSVMPLTYVYALRGAISGCRRPLCVRALGAGGEV